MAHQQHRKVSLHCQRPIDLLLWKSRSYGSLFLPQTVNLCFECSNWKKWSTVIKGVFACVYVCTHTYVLACACLQSKLTKGRRKKRWHHPHRKFHHDLLCCTHRPVGPLCSWEACEQSATTPHVLLHTPKIRFFYLNFFISVDPCRQRWSHSDQSYFEVSCTCWRPCRSH